MSVSPPETHDNAFLADQRRHLRFGWWALLCFLTLGIALEALHGFKVRWYLDVSNETRRLLWTLAHAHGVLLALVNIVFGLTVRALPGHSSRWLRIASPSLITAAVLLPVGFLLGGLYAFDGDAGVGVFLVPLGAVFLFAGVLVTAQGVQTPGDGKRGGGGGSARRARESRNGESRRRKRAQAKRS